MNHKYFEFRNMQYYNTVFFIKESFFIEYFENYKIIMTFAVIQMYKTIHNFTFVATSYVIFWFNSQEWALASKYLCEIR